MLTKKSNFPCSYCEKKNKRYSLKLIGTGKPIPYPKYIPQIKKSCADCGGFQKFEKQTPELIREINDALRNYDECRGRLRDLEKRIDTEKDIEEIMNKVSSKKQDKIIQIIRNLVGLIYALSESGNIYQLDPYEDQQGGGKWELLTESPQINNHAK